MSTITQMNQTYDEALPVDWIFPHPDNPNIGDREALAESIDELGFYGAILVRQLDEYEYQLLGGEHRWKETKERGGTSIPAFILHDVDDDAALKILLGDNEITRRGRYDHAKLNKVLTGLKSIRGTGFPPDVLQQLAEHEAERKAAKAAEETPTTNPGATKDEIANAAHFDRQYGIVINCADEAEQEGLYNRLVEIGVDPSTMRAVSI